MRLLRAHEIARSTNPRRGVHGAILLLVLMIGSVSTAGACTCRNAGQDENSSENILLAQQSTGAIQDTPHGAHFVEITGQSFRAEHTKKQLTARRARGANAA